MRKPDNSMAIFWGPLDTQNAEVLICVGTVVSSNTRPYRYKVADKNDAYPFLSLGSADAVASITRLFGEHHTGYFVQSAPAVNLKDLQAHPAVLVGAYTNEWTLQLTNNLRYRFSAQPKQQIYDSVNPSITWERAASTPYTTYTVSHDYGLVARYHDSVTENNVVIVAGLGINGTAAAATFITSPEYMKQLDSRLPRGWNDKNIEIVFESSVIKNEFGEPSIKELCVW
jgi:hypothetical protein